MRQIYFLWSLLPLLFFVLASLMRLREGVRPSTFFYGPRSTQVYFRYYSRPVMRLGFVFLFVWLASVILVELELSAKIGDRFLNFCPPELREPLLPALALVPTFIAMIFFRLIGWRQADHEPLSGQARIVQAVFVAVFCLIIVAGEQRRPDGSCPWCAGMGQRLRGYLPLERSTELLKTFEEVKTTASDRLGLNDRRMVSRLPPASSGSDAPTGDEIIDELLLLPADPSEPYRYLDSIRARIAESSFAAEKAGKLEEWRSRTAAGRRALLSKVLHSMQQHVRENQQDQATFPQISEWLAQGRWLPEDEFLNWLQRSVGAHDLILGSDTVVGNVLVDELFFTWGEPPVTP